jgi:hypothetical protein
MSIQRLLPWAKAKDAQVFGLTAGTVGSGIGAAHALGFHEVAGAFAGLAIALNGLPTALVLPLLVHFGPGDVAVTQNQPLFGTENSSTEQPRCGSKVSM